MKVNFKTGGETFNVDFTLTPTKDGGFSAIAKSSKDLDVLRTVIAKRGNTDSIVGQILAGHIEKQTKLPIDVDYNYRGAGYGFKIDMYSLLKSIK